MGLNFDETAPRVEYMDLFNSESKNYFNNGRSNCDIYWRGLRDGCRLEIEQDRIRRMEKEKEEEKETYKRRKNSKKEWDQDFKSKIKEEL